MSIPLETIYSYFESGDLPTQEQFRDSWSSFWHKDESILPSNVATVDKGETILNQEMCIPKLRRMICLCLTETIPIAAERSWPRK
jgi:hypothetical protein